jgi:hypothetical protein
MKLLLYRTIQSLILLIAGLSYAQTQSLQGAWEIVSKDIKTVRIHAGEYFAFGVFDAQTQAFVAAGGGLLKVEKGVMKETYEFHTLDASLVGKTFEHKVTVKNGTLTIQHKGEKQAWKQVDDGRPGQLAGAWLFSGRSQNGELQRREPSPRKTMKILSGSRFQWIAYNTATGEFFGTGGGTYTTENGAYVERIDFFSRDNSRVGAELPFEFELIEGEWHHKGFSSKGEALHELWKRRGDYQ